MKTSLFKSFALSAIIFCALFGFSLPTRAYSFADTCATGQVLYYTITSNSRHTVKVVAPNTGVGDAYFGYNRPTGALIIPDRVGYNGNGYDVTCIAAGAFSDCSGLTGVTIPNTVITLSGFSGCSSLTRVVIPNSVTEIGSSAFSGCTNLVRVVIPNSVTSIGSSAFEGCSGLTNVIIPNSVTSIGSSVFEGCSGLTNVIIPNSVTSIGRSAFKGCSGLTSVTISDSVIEIGYSAFSGCSGLTSVTIPNSVTAISSSTFSSCSSLTSVTIPNSVTSIGYSAFSGCSSLTSVTIPNSVSSIDYSAFSGCSSLTSVTIPNSVIEIGNNAFFLVRNIIYHGIATGSPWGALTLNGYVDGIFFFVDSTKTTLTGCMDTAMAVSVPNTVTAIDDNAFRECSSITGVTIPNTVTTLGDNAFRDCSSLSGVTLGNSVTTLGDYTFYGCSGLTSFTSNAVDAPTISGTAVFYGVNPRTPLFIPHGSRDSYVVRGWGIYFDIREQSSIVRTSAATYSVGTDDMRIVVRGAEGQHIRIYDNLGRLLSNTQSAEGVRVFVMPATGIYMVQVGNDPAHKVVLIH